MALIPWIYNGLNKTVVTEPDEFEISGNAVWIDNFDNGQFKEEGATNAAYDLRVGEHYRMYRKTRIQVLGAGDSFQLPPGRAAVVETEEQVFFPKFIFGLIVPKETMLRRGISIPPTKVDPGYPDEKDRPKRTGHLHITIFNHSEKPYEFKRGTSFCALCLFQVLEGIVPYGKGEKDMYGGPEEPALLRRIGKWLEANWWKLFTVIGVIIAILAYLKK
jgi:deoxycytidine triphosphate deaminase